eukprot:gene13510-19505_t
MRQDAVAMRQDATIMHVTQVQALPEMQQDAVHIRQDAMPWGCGILSYMNGIMPFMYTKMPQDAGNSWQ